MKRSVLFFVTIAMASALVLLSGNVKAQKVNVNNSMSELILGVPKATDKNLTIVTDAISLTKGLKFEQYCDEHRLILLSYDNTLFPTKEDVVKALQAQKVSMPMYIKEGSFKEANELCNSK